MLGSTAIVCNFLLMAMNKEGTFIRKSNIFPRLLWEETISSYMLKLVQCSSIDLQQPFDIQFFFYPCIRLLKLLFHHRTFNRVLH